MKQWNHYTSSEIKPCGWLKRQLQLQAAGLSGNLDKVWRDVRDSSWIGGDAEGWERVPYWLDGFIPLAYLLEDADMIARAKKYIDAIIANQKSDGWICPCSREDIPHYDTWAVLLLSKVLTVYYECSKDERIPDVIYRTLRNYYELLSSGTVSLFSWGKYRWFEGFIAIQFLWNRCQENWIRELALLIKTQGVDYEEKLPLWKRPLNRWTYDTHIVNVVMALKAEAVSCDILGDAYTGKADRWNRILELFNGTPVGLFTGDECLAGLSPIQGTELCAVAEQMYSYEHLYAYTGDFKWAELLELLAFNALPAAISDDMWTHQYDQLSNQTICTNFGFPSKPIFRTNNGESNLFGLEPGFGCCTANFNQAWPKFALSTFFHQGDTIINAIPVPSSLTTDEVSITLQTDYPFGHTLSYRIISKKDFTFRVRIPSFAKNLTIDGQTSNLCKEASFAIAAGENREITISFDADICLIDRPHDLKTVRRGNLVFSLPISYRTVMHEYTRDNVERRFPYCDYEYLPTSGWNYGYCDDFFTFVPGSPDDIPFSSKQPPVTILANMQKISWDPADGYDAVCAKRPASTTPVGDREVITLYPYACAKLRMTELPLVYGDLG